MCITKCFALGDQSINVNSRIFSAFSNTANHNASLLFNSTFVGCNPKPKNNDGNVAKQIAKDGGFKEALKECKKGEKTFGKTGKNNEPWAIRYTIGLTRDLNRSLNNSKSLIQTQQAK